MLSPDCAKPPDSRIIALSMSLLITLSWCTDGGLAPFLALRRVPSPLIHVVSRRRLDSSSIPVFSSASAAR